MRAASEFLRGITKMNIVGRDTHLLLSQELFLTRRSIGLALAAVLGFLNPVAVHAEDRLAHSQQFFISASISPSEALLKDVSQPTRFVSTGFHFHSSPVTVTNIFDTLRDYRHEDGRVGNLPSFFDPFFYFRKRVSTGVQLLSIGDESSRLGVHLLDCQQDLPSVNGGVDPCLHLLLEKRF